MSVYLPLFKALNEADVQYVVVGGLATVLHGYARLTADIDLVINLDQKESEKALKVLLSIGLKSRLPVDPMQFADETIRESWINEKNMMVFSFYHPDNPMMAVDIFVREPFPFQGMKERAVLMDIGGESVPVCAINDLIAMKSNTGRAKDEEDIKYLQGLLDNNEQ
ncbi:MAG: nucleotidyl transferase AbiEii/AbiGii toxin family protein [Thiohalophilus sp.]|uniref:nucleotidyl transferase AbiEii/AbiGii toxin family protein n=1 Tax=Thiohalophilus sp. TaxID=3028392 RepID=UPI0028706BE5|nr:nucleotidyl transferase AbiEii/AbiGii toxin family protein [Thiohalophilus sp.]MDR9437539.1 nucleotidyl transferase AbiEii/AbiGii toxin family protein [Thiohalophilus sp.]